jgi:hypothetical protein
MNIAEQLKANDLDPFIDVEASLEQLHDRAKQLLKWRDELWLIPEEEWTDELDQVLDAIEFQIINDWFPWLLQKVEEQRTDRKVRKATKKKRDKVLHLARSGNVDARRLAYSQRAVLGEFWPEQKRPSE